MFNADTLKQRGLISTGFHVPYNPRLMERARDLRRHMTPAESKLWFEYLQGFKYPVLRQKPIDNYIVDFYCAKLRLVIEIDGDSHFTDEGKSYDEERTIILESYGLRVLRFSNTDVQDNLEVVCRNIDGIPLPPLLKGFRRRGILVGCKGNLKKRGNQP